LSDKVCLKPAHLLVLLLVLFVVPPNMSGYG
jgi:hypothetical protein